MIGPSTNRRRQAFSLMELLAVVTILGIIAAILIPRVAAPTNTARDSVREGHMSQLNQLIELYHIENDAWPTALTDLEATYLPDGLPTDPDGGTYSINGTTYRVEYTP